MCVFRIISHEELTHCLVLSLSLVSTLAGERHPLELTVSKLLD